MSSFLYPGIRPGSKRAFSSVYVSLKEHDHMYLCRILGGMFWCTFHVFMNTGL